MMVHTGRVRLRRWVVTQGEGARRLEGRGQGMCMGQQRRGRAVLAVARLDQGGGVLWAVLALLRAVQRLRQVDLGGVCMRGQGAGSTLQSVHRQCTGGSRCCRSWSGAGSEAK